MHFVCLASDYERTHNNDLTVHVKTLQLPRTFTVLCLDSCHFFRGTHGGCYYIPKDLDLPEVQGLLQGQYVSKCRARTQTCSALLTLISPIPHSHPRYHQVCSLKELQSRNDKILYFNSAAFPAMEEPREESLISSLSSVKS